ncbi:MAG TPA: Abi family protein [Candidatus Stackebrandtia excrementipullorum]|nr:Abi family protein [Candidatus Stackebrandtia excrementipullorum]
MPQPRRTLRIPRSRGVLHYDKMPMELDDLVDRLTDRGLTITDRDRALWYLRHIGYYRLSPYTIPFQQGGPEHRLREGTSFDDILDLYVFDRALRLVVMDALERVEVAVRAALTDHMPEDRPKHLRRKAPRHSGRWRGFARPPLGPRALPHHLRLPRAPAVLAHGRDIDRRAADECIPEPQAPLRPDCHRPERRPDSAGARVLDADLRPRPQRLRPPRPALERRPRRLPRNPELAHSALARRRRSAVREIEEAALPGPGFLANGPGDDFPTQRLHELVGSRPAMNLRGMGIPDGWADDPFWRRHLR